MKNIIILALLGFSIPIHSQNYLSMNPEWKEYSVICSVANPICNIHEYTIRLDGDTIINNVIYFKTKREGVLSILNLITNTIISEEETESNMWPLREESGKFYVYHPLQEEDQLLHNFNLTVGDTAIGRVGCSGPQIIMEIDTVYFGTQIRKKFIFGPELSFKNSYLFEGIGTDQGLFVKPCYGSITLESSSNLHCYTTNNNEVLQIDTSAQCETTPPVNVVNIKYDEIKVNIYPNPFDEKITIETNFSKSIEIQIKIYNTRGELIKSIPNLDSQKIIEISTKGFVSGNYVLIIGIDGKFYAEKIMKF
jgi:hypothetical protein